VAAKLGERPADGSGPAAAVRPKWHTGRQRSSAFSPGRAGVWDGRPEVGSGTGAWLWNAGTGAWLWNAGTGAWLWNAATGA